MSKYKIGDKSNFSFGKKITNIKTDKFEFKETNNYRTCPNCGHELLEEISYSIVELLEIDNGEYYIAYSDKGHTLQIDKDKIKELIK